MAGRRIYIAAAAVAIAALLLVFAIFVRGGGSRGEGGPTISNSPIAVTSIGGEDRLQRPQTSGGPDEEGVTGGAVAEQPLDLAVDPIIEELGNNAQNMLSVKVREQIRKAAWEKEDAVLASMPPYEEVKTEYRKRAAELLETMYASTTADVIELAQSEAANFWAKRSLGAEPAYEHAYLARAILEVALEEDPDNFRLLTGSRHAISLTNPLFTAGRQLNQNAYDELWPIVDRQCAMVLDGHVEPSIEAMLAVNDWVDLAEKLKKDRQQITTALAWLVDNADRGGWGKLKPSFRQWLEFAENGAGLGAALYVYRSTETTHEERFKMEMLHTRLLPSHPGSPEFHKHTSWLWQDEASNTTVRTVLYDPNTGKTVVIDSM